MRGLGGVGKVPEVVQLIGHDFIMDQRETFKDRTFLSYLICRGRYRVAVLQPRLTRAAAYRARIADYVMMALIARRSCATCGNARDVTHNLRVPCLHIPVMIL